MQVMLSSLAQGGRLTAAIFLAFGLIAAAPANQAHAAEDDAELATLSQAFFQTLQTQGLGAVSTMMHPDALAKFHNMLMPLFELEAQAGQQELRSLTFGSSVTLDQIRAMDGVTFMGGFIRMIEAQAGVAEISFDKIEYLGSVAEGEARHAVVRVTVGSGEFAATQMEILSYQPYQDSWRLQLTGEMDGFAKALRAHFGAR